MGQYTESYPDVVQVEGEIEAVKEQLKRKKAAETVAANPEELSRINAEIAAISMSEEGLRRTISAKEIILRDIPVAKAGLEKLEREKQSQKAIYDQLYARQGQSEVSKEDKSTSFRVVDPASLPGKPCSPDRLKIMLMGIFGGIAGSFGVLLLLEQLDDCVKDVEFLRGLEVPVLAIIPKIEDPAQASSQRRRSRWVMAAAGGYLLLMLLFPLLELLGLTYVDRLLDDISSGQVVQGGTHGKGLTR